MEREAAVSQLTRTKENEDLWKGREIPTAKS